MTRNAEVADLLEEMAARLEAMDVEYKPRAYRRAAENVRGHPADVGGLAAEGQDAVEEIEGVGDAIAAKIVEYVETGGIEELEELRAELPADIEALTRVEGVGPKTVGSLYRELGVETLDDLEAAAEAGEIQAVKGFGPKTEQNILDGIDFARESHERALLGDARPLADRVINHLEATSPRPSSRRSPAGTTRARSSRPARRRPPSARRASGWTSGSWTPGSSVPRSSTSRGAATTTSGSGTAPSSAT